jgi:hypothetical protein
MTILLLEWNSYKREKRKNEMAGLIVFLLLILGVCIAYSDTVQRSVSEILTTVGFKEKGGPRDVINRVRYAEQELKTEQEVALERLVQLQAEINELTKVINERDIVGRLGNLQNSIEKAMSKLNGEERDQDEEEY